MVAGLFAPQSLQVTVQNHIRSHIFNSSIKDVCRECADDIKLDSGQNASDHGFVRNW